MLKFGISSFTGANLSNITDSNIGVDNQTVDRMRPRGLYRGLVMFDVRNTDYSVDRTTEKALNSKYINVGGVNYTSGGSSTTGDITSIYRRFHSRPAQSGAGDAGPIINAAPTINDSADTTSGNVIRSLSLGTNLNDIENSATAGMCYQDPAVAFYKNRDLDPSNPTPTTFLTNQESLNTGLTEGQDAANQGGNVKNDDITWTGPDKEHYWQRFKDAVVRLPDGSVEIDIMNTEHSPCVIEVVVHSRKGQFNRSKQSVFQQLWNDVESHLTAKNQLSDPDPSSNLTGGWQAFYDPAYPLLKIPSKGESRRFINEVHRSNHVLAPGQSKKVKIHLGSLYYKIGNKMDFPVNQTSFDKGVNNNGCLYFSIGHSGFEYPQSVSALKNSESNYIWTNPSSGGSSAQPYGNVAGTGFWVGKANAPSSISIDGVYTDKFYPVTFDRSPASIYAAGFPRIAGYLPSGGTTVNAIPLSTIVPQRVAISDDSVVQEL